MGGRESGDEDSEIEITLHKKDENKKLDMENGESCSASSDDNEFEEEFLYLLRVNELEEALELIKSKKVKNLNYRNEEGNTALHFVMANNLKTATQFLLKILKVNYNVLNNSGNSPLVWAVQNNSVDSIRVLLLHDFETNLNFIKNNSKEAEQYFEKEEIDSYLNYSPASLVKGKLSSRKLPAGTKELETDQFKLSEDVVEYYGIGERFNPDNKIDILKKNDFGKSLLSEVFNCNNLELLQLVLEHPISYSLDKSTNHNNYDTNDEGQVLNNNHSDEEPITDSNGEKFIIHDFNFTVKDNNSTINTANSHKDNLIRIKEISLNDGDILNSKKSELDRSGMMIWESSIMCSFWLCELLKRNEIYKIDPENVINENFTKESFNFEKFEKSKFENVIELGSGCGLVGLSFFKFCELFQKKLKKLVLSDLSSNTIENLKYNLNLNNYQNVEVIKLDWKNFQMQEKFQVVIGSDLIYDSSLVKPLVKTIDKLLDEGGIFLYCYKSLRNGSTELLNELVEGNYLVELRQVPREYQRNPLPGKTKEYCLSFFPDLESEDYFLLKAVKLPNV